MLTNRHYAPQPAKHIRQQQSCPQGCTPKFRRSYGDSGGFSKNNPLSEWYSDRGGIRGRNHKHPHVSYFDNGGVAPNGAPEIGIARAPEMQPHIIGREAEGPVGIHNQVTGVHRGVLGPMLSGQNQSLTNPAKPFQVITGFTPRYVGRGIFPKAHLQVFPTPSM